MSNTEIIPGWEIVRELGEGGFGKVYEIRKTGDMTGEYRSALKVITIPQSESEYSSFVDEGLDEESITSLLKEKVNGIVEEFRLMAEFKGNTNIVSYEDHSIVEHPDGKGWDIFIRMELLTPLPELFKKKGMTPADTVRLGIDMCKALETCGKKNIIHRDIKPANIFINSLGDYKLGDFGIAKSMDHMTQATKTGTYGYMAPEVYRGYAYYSTVDIYSLGLVLYWLLNERRLPFYPLPPKVPTGNETVQAQSRRFDGEPIPAPLNGCDDLKEIVLKACSYKPSERFQTPRAMRRALEDVLEKYYSENEAGTAAVPQAIAETESLLERDLSAQRSTDDNERTMKLVHQNNTGAPSVSAAAVNTAPPKPGQNCVYTDNSYVQPQTAPKIKKKKWIIPAACIALLLVVGLAAFIILNKGDEDDDWDDDETSSDYVKKSDGPFTTGSVSGKKYTNKYYGITFELPSGWEFASASDLREDNQAFGINYVPNTKYTDFESLYDMKAQNTFGTNIIVQYTSSEKIGYANLTKEQFLDMYLSEVFYRELGFSDMKLGEKSNALFGSVWFVKQNYSMKYEGIPIDGILYSAKKGDIFCTITISGLANTNLETYESNFK